mmetsp:Transcript_4504/g.4271  ORF Transcript_4504/g.4271 Transcript_4504/m.4271 type:complete len:150 (-) Transcript_4504:64-513(-)|eukprot:CAMPEP_0197837184 /NCGR_PEP_ID=MMETSP1437-20131217/31395_1 /TAXON_ID=49252 ORGANISM="Eucampia antarctica, Strain CCMP1452" /NCGR_SAMPLE_ID=MMETSP1437 /ASSEMBLY_ACC=CAM_ASM_001096 /LENGTH=149 /DNA_ID=CAMNT_0043444017 /DNA_START=84 /DNA_END=533 /DNA_ORIENTATION=-
MREEARNNNNNVSEQSCDVDLNAKVKKEKGKTCHALPCSIEYDGKAPVHLYFQPTVIEDGIQACQFRGRGILASKAQHLPKNVNGMVVMTTDGCRNLDPAEEFESITEWKHEWNPDKIISPQNNDTGVISRLQDLLDISHAVHDPILPP